MNLYTLPDGNVQISFSGGRTSAFMLHHILDANGGLPDRANVVFANTGREMPQTLDFVQECSDRWSIPIVWVELNCSGEAGARFRQVSHNSAARNGEPFVDLIRQRGIVPNQQARFCTAELKIRPTRDYLRSIGWDHWQAALGIRADEAGRVDRTPQRERWQRWYPLADAGVSKRDVMAFWQRQPFDLQLSNIGGKTPLGNCDGCFLKSEANIAALARDYPERHQWWQDMEDMVGEWTLGMGARFRKEYSRREIRWMVDHQGDWIFDAPEALCQADGGECTE
jgi:3'-phosphoadenosine 5'-phosphosulfate sulfotransferase (PAPS reductase)/FAD synthetase